MIWAIIQNNIVVNIIVYDGLAHLTLPAGQTLVHIANTYKIGDTYP